MIFQPIVSGGRQTVPITVINNGVYTGATVRYCQNGEPKTITVPPEGGSSVITVDKDAILAIGSLNFGARTVSTTAGSVLFANYNGDEQSGLDSYSRCIAAVFITDPGEITITSDG